MNTAGVSEPPGLWLRQQRVAAGLTQEDLAERSRVSVRAIADLERGRTRKPYPSSVRALVRALGLPDAAGTELVARYRTERDGQADGPGGTGVLGPGAPGRRARGSRPRLPCRGSCRRGCRTSRGGPGNSRCSTACSTPRRPTAPPGPPGW